MTVFIKCSKEYSHYYIKIGEDEDQILSPSELWIKGQHLPQIKGLLWGVSTASTAQGRNELALYRELFLSNTEPSSEIYS